MFQAVHRDRFSMLIVATVKKYLTVQTDGKQQVSREVEHVKLDVMIADGAILVSRRTQEMTESAVLHLMRGVC